MPRIHGAPALSHWGASVPTTGPVGTTATYIGIDFGVTVPGRIAGFRIYRALLDDGTHYGILQGLEHVPGLLHRAFGFPDIAPTVEGWQQTWIRPWFRPEVNVDYRLGIFAEKGMLWRNTSALAGGAVTVNHIQIFHGWQSTVLQTFGAAVTTNTNKNAVDILFQPD